MSEELFIHEFSPYCRMVDGFREWGMKNIHGKNTIRFDRQIGKMQKGIIFEGDLEFKELANLHRADAHSKINEAFENETQ